MNFKKFWEIYTSFYSQKQSSIHINSAVEWRKSSFCAPYSIGQVHNNFHSQRSSYDTSLEKYWRKYTFFRMVNEFWHFWAQKNRFHLQTRFSSLICFSTIFSRFARIKRTYLEKTPYEKWHFIRRINVLSLKLVGVHVMEKDYKINGNTFVPICVEAVYMTLLMNTLFHYRNEPYSALTATPSTGFLVPVSAIKSTNFVFIVKRNTIQMKWNFIYVPFLQCLILLILALYPPTRIRIRYFYNYGGDYIYANADISPSNFTVCNKMAIGLMRRSVGVLFLVFLSYCIMMCVPLYKTLYSDEKEMILPVILPFVEPDTTIGFYTNFANQACGCLVGALVVPGCELVFCVLINNVSLIAAVIENSIEEFRNQIEMCQRFSEQCNWQFRNIILKVLDFDRFVHFLNIFFY